MWDLQPWATSLIGGALIGLASVFLMATIGRIAGISGIVDGVLRLQHDQWAWKLVFVIGLLAGGGLYAWLGGPDVAWRGDFSPVWLLLAGFLVGFGLDYAEKYRNLPGIFQLNS